MSRKDTTPSEELGYYNDVDDEDDKYYLVNEESLAKDWLTPEEDKAWKDL